MSRSLKTQRSVARTTLRDNLMTTPVFVFAGLLTGISFRAEPHGNGDVLIGGSSPSRGRRDEQERRVLQVSGGNASGKSVRLALQVFFCSVRLARSLCVRETQRHRDRKRESECPCATVCVVCAPTWLDLPLSVRVCVCDVLE